MKDSGSGNGGPLLPMSQDAVAWGSPGIRLQTTGMPAAGISGAVAPLIPGIAFLSKSP